MKNQINLNSNELQYLITFDSIDLNSKSKSEPDLDHTLNSYDIRSYYPIYTQLISYFPIFLLFIYFLFTILAELIR